MTRARLYKPGLLLMAMVLLIGVSRAQNILNADRERLELTRIAPLENAPPVLAFTTVALGGFRGLISNVLWMRANELQDQGRYFEMVQLADWITKLEPTFARVWSVHAWNMSYNISVKFSDPADRWRWVQRGIELLRDEGLRYNPNETLLYRELAWHFQHKMGHNMDDAHLHYKEMWAKEMSDLLGEKPNYEELLNPQTGDARERVRVLRERYKMDPEIMQAVDELYGPLEWRLPDAHAIYWAEAGRRRAKGDDQQSLRRVIYQMMQVAFTRGGLHQDKITGRFSMGPNLDMLNAVNRTYLTMMDEAQPSDREHMKSPHKNFLRQAVYLLYLDSRRTQAQKWFAYMLELYPEGVAKGQTLDDYALDRMTEEVGETNVDQITAIIIALLRTSYVSLVVGDDEDAVNREQMAQRLWARYMKEIAGQEQRVRLEPMATLKQIARDQLLDSERGLPPEYADRLRELLGISSEARPAEE